MAAEHVYVPKPELTIFQDTFFECEIIKQENRNQYRLRVKSVQMGNGNELPDLTARNQDAIIIENSKKIFSSIESMKLASNERY